MAANSSSSTRTISNPVVENSTSGTGIATAAPGIKNLKVYNSLTRSLEEFVPVDPTGGRRVNWYSCGPTVYDASHMGHARSYISFDILRRVFSGYFGYDVFYVMNVTDIDDKIIKRARQEYLFSNYIASDPELRHLISTITEAIDKYVKATLTTTDPDKRKMREGILTSVKKFMAEYEPLVATAPNDVETHKTNIFQATRDVLYEFLDEVYLSNLSREKIDNEIFAQFARSWENDYFADMASLNVQVPDALTRVTEYVPEIVEFIEQIIKNGFAYESNNSVYFDVQKFRVSGDHRYAKLVPEAVGDVEVLQEGEGELTASRAVDEKTSPADFALWKRSKVGEPSWPSPWGQGRPGWHIECSVMASAIIGKELDVHTGGVDLKFPHHDNEIAQSEAFYQNDNWVKYFLHSGHLTIAGCKMSKSLKNFITIKDALEQYSSAQLRMTFLLHSWKDTLDYSPSGMLTAMNMEKTIQEYFLNVKNILRSNTNNFPKWTPQDLKFQDNIAQAKTAVHNALCDNVDTRTAMFALKDLIGQGNIYIQGRKSEKMEINCPLLKSSACFITKILRIFGVISSTEDETFGFNKQPSGIGATTSAENIDEESIFLPFVEVLSDFREKIRLTARSIEDTTVKSSILSACDLIRDEQLPALGVRLEDHEGCPPVLKFVGKEAMLKEKQAKEKLEEELRLAKEAKQQELLKAQQAKEAQKRIPPILMFQVPGEAEKYSRFDAKGIPTHDAAGNFIPKSGQKKLLKMYAAQEKKYQEYLKTYSESGETETEKSNSNNGIQNQPKS